MRQTLKVWMVVDSCGDYACGHDQLSALEAYESCIQPIAEASGWRYVVIDVDTPLPVDLTASVSVPDDLANALANLAG